MAIGGPAGPAFSHSRAGLGLGASMGFGWPSDDPDWESQVVTQEEGWGPFHLGTEDLCGSGGGGAYSHELVYPPTESTQTTGGGGNLQVHASVVPSFAIPAFAPNHAELYGARRSAQTSSASGGGSEDDMRVDSPRQPTRARHSGTEYVDMHTTQQAQHTTYEDSEWREEWVDEEMPM